MCTASISASDLGVHRSVGDRDAGAVGKGRALGGALARRVESGVDGHIDHLKTIGETKENLETGR